MDDFNWKPFVIFGFVMAAIMLIAISIMARSNSGPWAGDGFGPGMMSGGFFWILPILGFVMMMMFIGVFFSMFSRRGGPGDWMGGGRPRDPQSHSNSDPDDSHCPSCGTPV